MQRLLRYLAWLLAFAAGVCAAAGPATGFQIRIAGNGARDEPSVTGPYTLSGIVVDAVTGAPIRRALVQLVGAQSRFALTDEGGKFQFENLPQGQCAITAQKPGYSDPAGFPVISASTSVTIGAVSAPVVLKLEPQSAISIEVTDEDGEAVEALPVRLLGSRILQGRRYREAHRGGQTDEQGVFRAGNLTPGKYYVSVGPSSRPVGHVGEGAAETDVGYPQVFYPNAPDLEAAAPVEVIPGRQVHVALSVSTVPVFRISGAVVGSPPEQPCRLRLADNSGEGLAVGVSVNPTTGAFRSGQIPAGFYTLRASCVAGNENSFAGRVPLRLNSNLANVTVAVAPTASIPVTFRTNGSSAETTGGNPPAIVMLTERQPIARQARAWSQPEGKGDDRRTVVKGVEPGTYSVDIRANGNFYVESARYGSVDLLTDDLTVPEGAMTEVIEITLRNDGASASGMVRAGSGETPATGFVLLVPVRAPRFAEQTEILNGAFTISNLAPGAYRVIALDRVNDLEYTNPEELRDYLTKAQEVTLSPKQEARVNLELLRRQR